MIITIFQSSIMSSQAITQLMPLETQKHTETSNKKKSEIVEQESVSLLSLKAAYNMRGLHVSHVMP